MNKRVDAIIEEARRLTPAEQQELLARLPVEIDLDDGEADGTPEEIEEAWLEEVERRAAAVERGEAKLVDFDEVLAKARKRIGLT